MKFCSSPKSKIAGFTLLELMVTVLIVAILASIAAPSMTTYQNKKCVTAGVHNFAATILSARRLAMDTQNNMRLCASVDGETCATAADWSSGFIVFEDDSVAADQTGNGVRDATEKLYSSYTPSCDATVSVRSRTNTSTDVASFGFNFRGYSLSNLRHFIVVCPVDNIASNARGLLVELNGRTLQSHDLDANGIHEVVLSQDDGTVFSEEISCP
ncbi:GspH/FimT family pseudopilin [Teredinibacter sp. KSP-S5-2]|uniref:GspH/FimT family pseudopilin n=1 Tax=Teredinibacter sp. KSP-S5-2 TaxID=3034506 RepID=UPI00293437A9|nr:GspH/FimT family pseudopilin [Teredinibacter sp. KSP-S5-2]WNO09860.1 GspH/FimT family pseudopilin [Teredinibacter sp. KSP-S5-2]